MDLMGKKKSSMPGNYSREQAAFVMPNALIYKSSHISPLASLLYYPAGDFLSSVSGRLSMEVIWIAMNDYSPPNNLIYRKPVRSKR